jgi:hypothetical protein
MRVLLSKKWSCSELTEGHMAVFKECKQELDDLEMQENESRKEASWQT